jgi:hypothetical protein
MSQYYYRYTIVGNWISLNKFLVTKETDHTVELERHQRVYKNARASFAYPTKELAWESLLIRNNKYIQILTTRLEDRLAWKRKIDNELIMAPNDSISLYNDSPFHE